MALPVSIVIVSRHRPAALRRCLAGIAQLDYAAFEIVAVACAAGLDAIADQTDIKTVAFDGANISAARNLGIAQAAGEVVAFIDDDAVPEPLWLHHLMAPFETDPNLAAAGGFVIGRNGISFQWTARSLDCTGSATPLDVSATQPTILTPVEGRAIKTEGTNMAVRRDLLAEMGGFDPAFHFFHDEADLNMRLARAGHATAIVPLAQVHHGFAESERRARDRTPRSLFEIGASQEIFLQKHCPKASRGPAWDSFRAEQRKRVLRLLQRGPLDASDVRRLLRGLDAGRREAGSRTIGVTTAIARAPEGFLPFVGRQGAPRVRLAGRIWQARTLRKEAATAVQSGAIVSLFLFGPSARFHHLRFSEDGVWEQSGGLFGRSQRDAPLVQIWRFSRRLDAETQRITPVRGQFLDTNPA